VRRALKLMSDEPADDSAVASSAAASSSAVLSTESEDGEADTTPLPVILPSAASVQSSASQDTPRGPFEPAHMASLGSVAGDTAVPAQGNTAAPAPGEAAGPAPEGSDVAAEAVRAEPIDKLPAAATDKLDQIKDLLITAEAIGEANLDRHFERVSMRQRELIREFFDQAMPGREPES
jgi:hypothetical protein